MSMPVGFDMSSTHDGVSVKQDPDSDDRVAKLEEEIAALKDKLSGFTDFAFKKIANIKDMSRELREDQEFNAALKSKISSLEGILAAREKLHKSADAMMEKSVRQKHEMDTQLAYWKRTAHRATVDSAIAKNQDINAALDVMAAGDPAKKSLKAKPRPTPRSSNSKRKLPNIDDAANVSRPSKKAVISSFSHHTPSNLSAPNDQMAELEIGTNGEKTTMSSPYSGEVEGDNDNDDDDCKPLMQKLKHTKQDKLSHRFIRLA